MRLTHIRLSGFKSFADHTVLSVPGQLVAVVGPNGCGKSNVIDAVRWVLGEASAKQLRGESMRDVIFNGAAGRRPAPRAAVELVFDNSDSALQGPWGRYSEISVGRKLSRSGESAYTINGQAVRRRDITDLFLGTGVGTRGYAVIEQGMISRLIEARPEELRVYLEEAAGISKYKERRRETESRLKDTAGHLQRLADIRQELSGQIEKLRQQAEDARLYSEWNLRLESLQHLTAYIRHKTSLEEADAAGILHQESLLKEEKLTAGIDGLNSEVQSLRRQEQNLQEESRNHDREHALLREQWARLEEQVRQRRKLEERYRKEQLQAGIKMKELSETLQQLREEKEMCASDIDEAQMQWEGILLQTEEEDILLPEQEERVAAADDACRRQQLQQSDRTRLLALKHQELQRTVQLTDRLSARLILLQEEEQRFLQPLPATPADNDTQNLKKILAEDESAFLVLTEACKALQNERALQEVALKEWENQEISLQARLQTLATLLPEQHDVENSSAPAGQPLWQQIEVESRWQHAVSAALGSRLHAAVCTADMPPDPGAGQRIWVNRKLPYTAALPEDALSAKVHCTDPVIDTALKQFLHGIRCAAGIEEALSRQPALANGEILITPEGHCADSASVCFFAEENQDDTLQKQQLLHVLTAEKNALGEPLQQQRKICGELAGRLQQLETENEALRLQIKNRQQQLQESERLHNERQLQAVRDSERLARIRRDLEETRDEHAKVSAQALGLQEECAALQLSEESGHLAVHQADTACREEKEKLKQLRVSMHAALQRKTAAENAVFRLQQKNDSLDQSIRNTESDLRDWQARQAALDLQEEEPGSTQEDIERLDLAVAAAAADCRTALEALQAVQQRIRETDTRLAGLTAALPACREEVRRYLLQQQEALLNAKHHHDMLLEAGADLDALAALQADKAVKIPSSEIAALSRKLQALGAVNLAAPGELEAAEERMNYYLEQEGDLTSAVSLLEDAISKIDNETKILFKQTFDAVNQKVQTYFPTLFGGGKASLEMIGDDLLNSGVAVTAQPPGKKNSTIHLLSGGEKALTAMSLVFALFSLNPAPFCLLDEVDAPLDDANTGRFCNLVREMSERTQFLYISHNRLTMEMAEQLIGVTMQEKGVSRVVAVDVQDAVKLAEPGITA